MMPAMNGSETGRGQGPRMVEISTDEAGQRIDNFLLARLKGVPKSRVYRMLRTGEVRVNKGRIRQHYRLRAGDVVRIPPVRTSAGSGTQPPPDAAAILEQGILFEDERLIILNKPTGMAVHGGSGLSYGVIEAMRSSRPNQPYLELVHRLDRDTSGCLMIAKRRSMLRRLHELLREGMIRKNYLALVCGNWPNTLQLVDAPLRKNTLRSGERIVCVSDDGRPASTVFDIRQRFADSTLLWVKLETGRTHQIRVHCAHAGFPIAGDDKYGDETCQQLMQERGLRRLFLHAAKLSFTTDVTGKVNVSAPLPDDLEQVLSRLDAG